MDSLPCPPPPPYSSQSNESEIDVQMSKRPSPRRITAELPEEESMTLDPTPGPTYPPGNTHTVYIPVYTHTAHGYTPPARGCWTNSKDYWSKNNFEACLWTVWIVVCVFIGVSYRLSYIGSVSIYYYAVGMLVWLIILITISFCKMNKKSFMEWSEWIVWLVACAFIGGSYGNSYIGSNSIYYYAVGLVLWLIVLIRGGSVAKVSSGIITSLAGLFHVEPQAGNILPI